MITTILHKTKTNSIFILILCLISLVMTGCGKLQEKSQTNDNVLMPIDQIEPTLVKYATIKYYTQESNYIPAVSTCNDNQAGSRKQCLQYVYQFIADNKGLSNKIAEENLQNMQYDLQNKKLIDDNQTISRKYNVLVDEVNQHERFKNTVLILLIINAIFFVLSIKNIKAWLIQSGWLDFIVNIFKRK